MPFQTNSFFIGLHQFQGNPSLSASSISEVPFQVYANIENVQFAKICQISVNTLGNEWYNGYLGLTFDNKLYGIGYIPSYLNNGTMIFHHYWSQLPVELPANTQDLRCGLREIAFITDNNDVYYIGQGDSFGYAGTVTYEVTHVPAIQGMVDLAIGNNFCVYVNEDKEVYGCGESDYYQLGFSSFYSDFTRVPTPYDAPVLKVGAAWDEIMLYTEWGYVFGRGYIFPSDYSSVLSGVSIKQICGLLDDDVFYVLTFDNEIYYIDGDGAKLIDLTQYSLKHISPYNRDIVCAVTNDNAIVAVMHNEGG